MMRLVRSGNVRTGGYDGCGTIGDTVTASPEEDEDMPVGVGRVRGVVGLGWWVISPVAGFSVELVGAVDNQLNRVAPGWDRKANRAQLVALIGSDSREGSTTT